MVSNFGDYTALAKFTWSLVIQVGVAVRLADAAAHDATLTRQF
jgi:hypothetical protein